MKIWSRHVAQNMKDSALSDQGRIFQIFRSYFGQNNDFIFYHFEIDWPLDIVNMYLKTNSVSGIQLKKCLIHNRSYKQLFRSLAYLKKKIRPNVKASCNEIIANCHGVPKNNSIPWQIPKLRPLWDTELLNWTVLIESIPVDLYAIWHKLIITQNRNKSPRFKIITQLLSEDSYGLWWTPDIY